MNKNNEIRKLNLEYSKLPSISKEWDLSSRFVPGEGPLNAEIMLVGQAPGRNEDIQLRPFIGTSGKFLDKLIGLAGLERGNVYICSVVQFFPPENRIPTDQEVEMCKPFLLRQIEIVNPKLIIMLGSLSCKTLADVEQVSKNHGKMIKKENVNYFVSLHPSAAVRIRTKMPIMEKDFRRLKQQIKKL
ncbi:MAG: uracil-DNA glycosylase [Candidatus Micrarchaeaceae archaeon]